MRNISGQHEKEIDALGSAAGSPTCYRHQPNDQEGSHSAHYVGTVLLCCEQLGPLSFLSNCKPQWCMGTSRSKLVYALASACEYPVNLGGHDEIVLMQSLDLLGLQRDRGIAPTKADIRMMAFSFREFTNLLNKEKRLPEVAKPEAPLDAMSFVSQLPVWGLCVKDLS